MPTIDPFIYCDYLKYQGRSSGVSYDFYIQTQETEVISFITIFNTSVRLWLSDNTDHVEIITFLQSCKCDRIAMQSKYISNYSNIIVEPWFEVLMKKECSSTIAIESGNICEKLSFRDFTEVAALLYYDKSVKTNKNLEELSSSMYYRNRNDNCKNMIIKCEGQVASHVCTSMETSDVAIIDGVVTDVKYRNKGLASTLISYLCNKLLAENKEIYLFAYNPGAILLYKKLGFYICEEYAEARIKNY